MKFSLAALLLAFPLALFGANEIVSARVAKDYPLLLALAEKGIAQESELRSELGHYRSVRVEALTYLKRFPEAREELGRLLEIASNDWPEFTKIGVVGVTATYLMKLREDSLHAKALEFIENDAGRLAEKIQHKTLTHFYYQIALVYVDEKNIASQLHWLKKALAFSGAEGRGLDTPHHLLLMISVGLLNESRGDGEAAKQTYDAILTHFHGKEHGLSTTFSRQIIRANASHALDGLKLTKKSAPLFAAFIDEVSAGKSARCSGALSKKN